MSAQNREEFFERWSRLHGDAEIKGIVRGWLTLSFHSARLLQRLGITANGVTMMGVLISSLMVVVIVDERSSQSGPLLAALALLILSLAADGIDGSLAIVMGEESRIGAALDAIADRLVEALWAYTFILIGADFRWVIACWLIAQTQEYIRARLGGLGITGIGVVTIAERPVRASILAVAFVIAIIYSLLGQEVLIGLQREVAIDAMAILWLGMQSIALWQVARFAIRSTIGAR